MLLDQLEQQFKSYMLYQHPDILEKTISTKSLSSPKRLDIYREAYYLRLLEIIQSDYPVTRNLLGEEQFEAVGRQYINEHPSSNFNIRYYGQDFAKYLVKKSIDVPHVPEMAAFELLLNETLIKADAPLLTFNELAALPPEAWEGLQLFLHPSVSILASQYNITELYQAYRQYKKLPQPRKLIKTEPKHIVIWRFAQTAYFLSIPEPQHWMIQAAASGLKFSALCEGLCQWHDTEIVGQIAASYLHESLTRGMISSYALSSDFP